MLQPLWWCCVDCVIHHERDVCEEQKYICMARACYNKRDCDAWSLLLLGAPVGSIAHMPLGISNHNSGFLVRSSFWISLSCCKLTILPDIQPANQIVIISGAYYTRDERTVKFFSPSPVLIHKNGIQSGPDPQNFWKLSVRSSPDPPM